MFVQQKTLKESISGTGVGLHSGERVSVTLHPAEPDSGIVLVRSDVAEERSYIPLSWRNVVDTRLATTVGNDHGVTVGTIEHLMSALAGCGIDNALIEVNGPEMPIMDGSAAPFVQLIEQVGVVEQHAPRLAIKVLKPVSVSEDGRSLALLPSDDFSIDFEIEFPSGVIARQRLFFEPLDSDYGDDIAGARTFGFEHEVEALRNAGLALGGSLANAVVVSGDKVLNEEGLRYEDEFVRHKILDCIGDLYLSGAPLIAHVRARCSGHALNNRLLSALFADPEAWCYTRIEETVEEIPAVPEIRIAAG